MIRHLRISQVQPHHRRPHRLRPGVGNSHAKTFSLLIHPRAKFTDGTLCTIEVAEALLDGADPARPLQTWGRRYERSGGRGQRFAVWLAHDDPQPYGGYGDGAAMRVAPAAWQADTLKNALALADRVTRVAHDHPEGLKGAAATVTAIFLAMCQAPPDVNGQDITNRFGYDLAYKLDPLRPGYRHSEACPYSVPQALVCALEASGFEDAIRNAIARGGDSNTLAAIRGAVAEARFGILEPMALQTWAFLPEDMQAVLRRLCARLQAEQVCFSSPANWIPAGFETGRRPQFFPGDSAR